MKFTLTQSERETLVELMTSEGWPALLKIVDQLVSRQQEALLTYDLSAGAEKLVHTKARVEGARRLQADIEAIKKNFIIQAKQ